MKKILLISIAFILTAVSYAQNFQITGQIKDNTTKAPVVFCYVNVLTPKDSILTTCFTDDAGFFKASLAPGAYKLAFVQIGYVSDTTEVFAVSGDKFLDVYKLQVDENVIEAVNVTGTSNKTYLDKEVQLVTSDMKNGVANTYDVMDKMKGLSYDRYNDKIKVDNDENVVIIVNGIEKDENYIKSLSPDRLQKIEIIRAPSGKYALMGYTAVINIILKDDYKGYDVSVENMSMFNFSKASTSVFPVDFGRFTVSYTNNRLNIYGGYTNVFNNFKLLNERRQYFSDSSETYFLSPENKPSNLNVRALNSNFNVGADFYISPKHILSYESKFDYSPESFNITDMKYDVSVYDDILTDNFISSTYQTENRKTFENSLFYVANFNERNNLKVSYAFSVYENSQISEISQDAFMYTQISENSRNYSAFNADYSHSVSPKVDYNIGYGNTFKDVNNFYTVESSTTSNTFAYTDFRNQLYGYLSYKPTQKLGFKIGAAAENSSIKYEDQNPMYFIYLPHLDINYKPIKVLDITAKFRSNSTYPTIDQANPFEIAQDWQSVSIGNPNLKPSKNNTVSLRLSAMGSLVSVEPYYTFADNTIIQIIDKRTDGMFEMTYENAGNYTKKGIKANFTIPFGKQIFWQNSADFFGESISYNSETHNLNDWTMRSQLIYRNEKAKTVAGFMYQKELRKVMTWTGYQSNNNDFWAVLVQQPFLEEKLSVMLIYGIPTNFGVTYDQGSYIKTALVEEFNYVDLTLLKNLIMFRITYRFSKGKSSQKIEKNINIEEAGDSKSII
jgi:hypothetical protein